ncbi:MAG: hypothetical protein EXS32_09290 [Opitutus sp.]|nr:hypothetical protein [Opitutus sp.]
MIHPRVGLRFFLSSVFATITAGVAAPALAYLFSAVTKNGENGRHLAWSADALDHPVRPRSSAR